jgi:hypothetical protein
MIDRAVPWTGEVTLAVDSIRNVSHPTARSPLAPPDHAKSPTKQINLFASQNGRPKAKLLKFNPEWLRACNRSRVSEVAAPEPLDEGHA